MKTDSRTLGSDEPLALEVTAALKQGEVELLSRLLAANPGLAGCVVEAPNGGARTLLHLLADWPGHVPNAAAIVQTLAAAGADLDAPAVDMRHRETPLHWAASNDDVVLIDALLDAGARLSVKGRRLMVVHRCPRRLATPNGRQRGGWSNAAREPCSGTKRHLGCCRRSCVGSSPGLRHDPRRFRDRSGTPAVAGNSAPRSSCWRTVPISTGPHPGPDKHRSTSRSRRGAAMWWLGCSKTVLRGKKDA